LNITSSRTTMKNVKFLSALFRSFSLLIAGFCATMLLFLSLSAGAQQWSSVTVKKFNGTAWEAVGSEGFSVGSANNIRIATGPDGTPYVVYQDFSEGSKATVQKFNGSAWVPVGAPGISNGFATWPAIAIGSDGTPFIVYSDYAGGSKATVKKFNGAAWVNAGNPYFSAGIAEYTEIALSSTNIPYVLYRDISAGYKTTVKRLNGAVWTTVGQEGFSDGNVFDLSIAIAPNDTVYAAYQDMSAGGSATVKKFNGTQWETVGEAGITGGNATDLSLVAMNNNKLCLAYANWRARVTCFEAGIWKTQSSAGIVPGSANYPQMSISNAGIAYLAYTSFVHVPVLIYTPPAWVNLPSLPNFAGSLEYPKIATTPLGFIYVACMESTNQPDTSIVRIFQYDGAAWTALSNTGLDYENLTILDFAVDKTGVPYLVYSNNTNTMGYKLVVSRFNGSVWEPVGDAFPIDINSYKLAFSADNTPYLAYRNNVTSGITVQKFTGVAWEPIGSELSVPGSSSDHIDFAVSANGTPYVLYKNIYQLRVARLDGNLWTPLGDTISPKPNNFYALALAGNTPYVLYEDFPYRKGVVKKWDGQAWTMLGGGSFSADEVRQPSIFATNTHTVFVAYESYGSYGLFVKSFDDDACTSSVAISGPDTVLTDQTVSFSAGAGFASYFWNAGAGVVLNGQGTAQVQLGFAAPGTALISLTVTDSEGCTYVASRNVIVSESVGTQAPAAFLWISPNPFSDRLYFELTQMTGSKAHLRVSDASGRIRWERMDALPGVFQLETASWPSGMYFLQLDTEQQATAVWRLVKM